MIIEKLDISGEPLIKFSLEIEGDSTKRKISNEDIEKFLREDIIQSIEDMGITVDDSRMYNFDIYESREEVQ